MRFKTFLYGFILTLTIAIGINYDALARLVSGTLSHNHSSATAGGGTIAPTSLTIPSGTTLASPTVTGTLTNSGTISGGTVSPVTMSASGAVSGTTITGTGLATVGAFTTSGTITSTSGCDLGFFRILSNLCVDLSPPSRVALTRDTCTTVTTLSVNAKAVLIRLLAIANAANSGGVARNVIVNSYTAAACGTIHIELAQANAFEFTTKPNSTRLQSDSAFAILPLDSSQDFFLKFSDDVGDSGEVYYEILGYFN